MDSSAVACRSSGDDSGIDDFATPQWQLHYRVSVGERLHVAPAAGLLATPALADGLVLNAGIHPANGVGGLLLLDADGGFNFLAPSRCGRASFDLLCRAGAAFVTGRLLIDVLADDAV